MEPHRPEPQDSRRGYLQEDFRIFHLRDQEPTRVGWHWHEFDKLVLLLSGSVTYFIGDASYTLKPGQLLLVRHGELHKPVVATGEPYERYVIWTSPAFLRQHSKPEWDPGLCLAPNGSHLVIDLTPGRLRELLRALAEIEADLVSVEYGAPLAAEHHFILFMLTVCRIWLEGSPRLRLPDGKLHKILAYIDDHLEEDLSVDRLAGLFYLSPSHLMHLFKAGGGGLTLHQHITRRRILRAAELLQGGMPAGKAAEQVGYGDYSSFLRAFRQVFKTTPRAFLAEYADVMDIEEPKK